MLNQSAIQSFFHADYSGTQQLLKQILEPIFGDYELGYDEITKSQTIKEKAKAAHIKTIKHVATFDAEGLQIKLFDVTLENNCHIHVARKNIQQLVREYVEKFEGAFIVFHYEHPEGRSWRLSYLEKRQNNAASTNAKRYTYLCGKNYPCRTIAERFYALQSQDLNAINLEKAFSVEALSDEFFTEYTAQYNNICKYIYENRTDTTRFGGAFADCEDKFIRDYVKKMMGRITFLHFLQKKGWMGVPQNAAWGQGDVNFMYHLFEYASGEQKEDFLDQVLEPIFFDCLNAPREKDLYDTHVAKIGTVRIPYLNGGLFEKDEIDEPQSTLPKEIFENLLDFYARFNFTIDENDPLDAEVGVDPEMLGKIFENLLEDNKDKGAFYTPKEIVNYMCKESLIAYLVSEAQQASEVNKQRQENFDAAIRALVEDPEMKVKQIKRYDEKQLEVLSRALMEVKICDPAIGSGAFPMGLLNLLFKCRTAVNNALGQNVPPAELKKDIIRNNIYGVDIEKGAIDIARLRFWLSIVVDLEEPEALPNFDYKFMQGNSLLEQFAGVDLSDMFATKATEGKGSGVQLISFDEVSTTQTILHERLRHYFGMRTGEDKHQLREKVNQAVADLICAKVNEAPELVSQIRDIDVSANDKFFLWHTWFAEVFNRPSKQGFDIVIGNPPYIQLQRDGSCLANIYSKQGFDTFNKTGDIYSLFYEKGTKLLRMNGILCYITSNAWMRNDSGKETRRFFINKCDPKLLVNFAGIQLFNATVETNILILKNSLNQKRTVSVTLDESYDIKTHDIATLVRKHASEIDFSIEDSWAILTQMENQIIAKVNQIATPLSSWDIKINFGLKTGYNKAFIIDSNTRDNIYKEALPDEQELLQSIILPVLRGRDIKRYEAIWDYKWIINTHNGLPHKKSKVDVSNLPSLKKHLDNYWEQISIRSDMGATPYNLRNCAYLDELNKPKIIWGEISDRSKFCYDQSGEFVPEATTFFMTGEISIFLLCYLNSKLAEFLFSKIATTTGMGTVRWKKYKIEQLRVPRVSVEFKETINSIYYKYVKTKDIIYLKKIDGLIYQLYELTPDEIALIEQAN